MPYCCTGVKGGDHLDGCDHKRSKVAAALGIGRVGKHRKAGDKTCATSWSTGRNIHIHYCGQVPNHAGNHTCRTSGCTETKN